jgi:hypothetical protein
VRSVARTRAILATALGVLAVIALGFFIRDYVPSHNWLFTGHYAIGFEDLLSRTRDISHIRHHANLYSVENHAQYFTYPPAALFLFWPLNWASFHTDALVWTLICLAALAGSLAIACRTVIHTDGWTVAAGSLGGTIAAIALLPVISLGFALGQVGELIMLALALDYLVLRGRPQGVLTGIVAAFKIYPAVFIIGWLIRREWRPAFTAIGSGAVVSVLAWAVFPTFTRTFISRQLFSGNELTHFLHSTHWISTSSSPYTIFYRWPFDGGSWASPVGWLASLAVVALGMWATHRLWRAGRPLSSFCTLMGACVLAGPVTWDHYYTFAPLLVLVAWENRDRRPLAVAAIVALVIYALPVQLARNESLSVHGFSARAVFIFFARNALSGATVLVMLAALWVTRSGEGGHDVVAPRAQVGVAVGGGAPETHDDDVEGG